MRIAVSGTHAAGKSTLIDAFLARHRGYAHEAESAELLDDAFAESLTVESFEEQLRINIDALRRYREGEDVIFERSPLDYVAYIAALGSGGGLLNDVRSAVAHLDLIVFLPLDGRIDVGEDEYPDLREKVDDLLHDILLADRFDLWTGQRPVVIEARGSVEQRLAAIEEALK